MELLIFECQEMYFSNLGARKWNEYTDLGDKKWTDYTVLGDKKWTGYMDLGDNYYENFLVFSIFPPFPYPKNIFHYVFHDD